MAAAEGKHNFSWLVKSNTLRKKVKKILKRMKNQKRTRRLKTSKNLWNDFLYVFCSGKTNLLLRYVCLESVCSDEIVKSIVNPLFPKIYANESKHVVKFLTIFCYSFWSLAIMLSQPIFCET